MTQSFDVGLSHKKSRKWHNMLAKFFTAKPNFYDRPLEEPNTRKYNELVYQQIQSRLWDNLNQSLMNLMFLHGKIQSGCAHLRQYRTPNIIELPIGIIFQGHCVGTVAPSAYWIQYKKDYRSIFFKEEPGS